MAKKAIVRSSTKYILKLSQYQARCLMELLECTNELRLNPQVEALKKRVMENLQHLLD